MTDLNEPIRLKESMSHAKMNNEFEAAGKRIEELEQAEKDLIKANQRIKALEQAIMSNCYDDPSTSGKRLMALATKRGEKL